jgi:hypothetical protein
VIIRLNVITGKETKPVKIQWGPGCMMIDMPENKATLVTILGAAADKGILVTETSEQIEALIKEGEK